MNPTRAMTTSATTAAIRAQASVCNPGRLGRARASNRAAMRLAPAPRRARSSATMSPAGRVDPRAPRPGGDPRARRGLWIDALRDDRDEHGRGPRRCCRRACAKGSGLRSGARPPSVPPHVREPGQECHVHADSDHVASSSVAEARDEGSHHDDNEEAGGVRREPGDE